MSSNSSSSSVGGIGFTGLLTIVLIVLKLTGFIDWSWWLVIFGPFLCVLALVVVACVAVFAGAFLFFVLRELKKQKVKK